MRDRVIDPLTDTRLFGAEIGIAQAIYTLSRQLDRARNNVERDDLRRAISILQSATDVIADARGTTDR